MKWPLIKNVLAYEFNVIGQERKETALYLIPEKIAGKRDAPRKMGNKIEREMAMHWMKASKNFMYMENFRR